MCLLSALPAKELQLHAGVQPGNVDNGLKHLKTALDSQHKAVSRLEEGREIAKSLLDLQKAAVDLPAHLQASRLAMVCLLQVIIVMTIMMHQCPEMVRQSCT